MKFGLTLVLPAPVEVVLAAFTDPDFLASLGALATVGAPEMIDQERSGDQVRQRMRYRFTGELSPVVSAVVDRDRLVWVDEHTYDLHNATATFRIVPDHFGDRLECHGSETYEPDGGTTVWHVEADLRVRWPVVGAMVERAIVSGLLDALNEEVELLRAWLSRSETA